VPYLTSFEGIVKSGNEEQVDCQAEIKLDLLRKNYRPAQPGESGRENASGRQRGIVKTVIFDVDGTLVDSVDLHARAWQQTFEHFGHAFPFDQVRSQIGKGGDQSMPVFLSKEELESRGKAIEEYRSDLFKKHYLSQAKPFPQVRALFERLLADDFRIALASSAKSEELNTYKEIAQITDLLEAEASSEDAEKSKPHPDIFLAAVKHLGHALPQECIVVGDSPYDAEAAGKAGITAVGVLCGGFPEQELRKAGFREIYKDPADLLQQYEQSLFYQQQPRTASAASSTS
jgi:HAD superfamily hydrolase (TIGR01509 family)